MMGQRLKVMLDGLLLVLAVVVVVLPSITEADGIRSFTYNDFSSVVGLYAGGTTVQLGNEIILCQNSSNAPAGTLFFAQPIQVRGFQTSFTYTVTNYSRDYQIRRDGLAFIMHLDPAGYSVVGPSGAGLGYGDTTDGGTRGILNSIVIEFDSFPNPELGDPDGFHVSIHVNPGGHNNANESYSIYMQKQEFLPLSTQHVRISYLPTSGGYGTLNIIVGTWSAPAFNLSLAKYIPLDPTAGSAYVGFSASHGPGNDTFVGETFSIQNWVYSFTGNFATANSVVYGLDVAEAGAGLVFYLQAVDQYGNNMTTDGITESGQALAVTLTQPGLAAQIGTFSYTENGLYKILINATVSGDVTVALTLGGKAIGSSPYTLLVTPSDPYPLTSYPYGSGLDITTAAGTVESFWIQLRDIFSNNITTNVSALVSATILGDGQTFYASVSYDPSGRHFVQYNVTLSASYTITTYLNNQATDDATHSLEVIPAAIDPGTSLLYGMGLTVTAGENQPAFVQLKDVYGNNVTDIANNPATVTFFALSGSINVTGTITPLADGLFSIIYNATTMGVYHLAVYVNGGEANGYYTQVQVVPAAVNTLVSYAYGSGLVQGTAGYLTVLFVQLTDTFGNNVTTTLDVSATIPNSPWMPITSPLTPGLYQISVNITTATTYQIQVQANGTVVKNGNSALVVGPAEVFPPTCEGYGAGLNGEGIIVGVNNSFVVQLRDRYSNNITNDGSEQLLVVVTDMYSTFEVQLNFTFVDGLYLVEYNITLASDFTINITVDGQSILNTLTNLTLLPGATDPSQCVATGDLDSNAVAGVLRTFVVQLKDAFANNKYNEPNPDGLVSAQFATGNIGVSITYSSGVYTCTYNATIEGSYTLTILVNGSAIQNSQFVVPVIPAAPYPPLCLAEGQALSQAVAGSVVTFSIFMFDVFNNSITPSTVTAPAVSITGSPQQPTVTANDALSEFIVTYNITVASPSYRVVITVDNTQIGIPPSTLVISPAPLDISNCLATGSSIISGTAGVQGIITVQLRDTFNNSIEDYTEVNSFNFQMNPSQDNTTNITQNGDGSYTLTYNITQAGVYTNNITVNAQNILGSPFNTLINPSSFDPHGTTTQGLQHVVTAGNYNNFTVQLKDIFGNPITDNVVPPDSIILNFGATQVADRDVESKGDGVYAVEYNYTVAGTYLTTVTINGVPVGTTPIGDVMVTPASVYAPACSVVGLAPKAFVERTTGFMLIVRDRYDNLCNGSTIAPVVQLTTTGEQPVVGTAALQANGTYYVAFFLPSKATYQLTISFGGEHITGSPFTVEGEYSSNAPPTFLIVGCVVGGVAFLAIVAFIGYRLYLRRRSNYVLLE